MLNENSGKEGHFLEISLVLILSEDLTENTTI